MVVRICHNYAIFSTGGSEPGWQAETPALQGAERAEGFEGGVHSGLAEDPGSHGALVLDEGGFDGVEEVCAEFAGEREQQGFIDEVAFGAIGEQVVASGDVYELGFDADGGGKAAEEEAIGLECAPGAQEHGAEVFVVAGEVEHGAAEDDVGEGGWEGETLQRFGAEVGGGQGGRELRGESADVIHGLRVGVRGEDFVALAEQVDEVATGAAAGIEDAHAGDDAAAQKLIEEIDIDLAELLFECGHERGKTRTY